MAPTTSATQFATLPSKPEPTDEVTEPFGEMKNWTFTVPLMDGFASSSFS